MLLEHRLVPQAKAEPSPAKGTGAHRAHREHGARRQDGRPLLVELAPGRQGLWGGVFNQIWRSSQSRPGSGRGSALPVTALTWAVAAQQGVRAERRFPSHCRVLPGQTPPGTHPACARNLCIRCAPRDVSKVNLSRHFLKLGEFAIGTSLSNSCCNSEGDDNSMPKPLGKNSWS